MTANFLRQIGILALKQRLALEVDVLFLSRFPCFRNTTDRYPENKNNIAINQQVAEMDLDQFPECAIRTKVRPPRELAVDSSCLRAMNARHSREFDRIRATRGLRGTGAR